MPELPEVETIKRQLQKVVVGKTVNKIEILEPKMFLGDPKELVGKKIIGVERRAKVLRIMFENSYALLVHLKLNGQLLLETQDKQFDRRFTRVIINFSDGTKLLFNDSRKFAQMKLVQNYQEKSTAIEPFLDNFTKENLQTILAHSRKPIKVLLMDQDKISGIGNIYANESLFAAAINPFRPANSLSTEEVKRLFTAIKKNFNKSSSMSRIFRER